jgi:hypothetical protein
LLSRFLTTYGTIVPRIINGNCAKHQRKVSRAIKKAKELGLIQYKNGLFAICNPFPQGSISYQEMIDFSANEVVKEVPVTQDFYAYYYTNKREASDNDDGGVVINEPTTEDLEKQGTPNVETNSKFDIPKWAKTDPIMKSGLFGGSGEETVAKLDEEIFARRK